MGSVGLFLQVVVLCGGSDRPHYLSTQPNPHSRLFPEGSLSLRITRKVSDSQKYINTQSDREAAEEENIVNLVYFPLSLF